MIKEDNYHRFFSKCKAFSSYSKLIGFSGTCTKDHCDILSQNMQKSFHYLEIGNLCEMGVNEITKVLPLKTDYDFKEVREVILKEVIDQYN